MPSTLIERPATTTTATFEPLSETYVPVGLGQGVVVDAEMIRAFEEAPAAVEAEEVTPPDLGVDAVEAGPGDFVTYVQAKYGIGNLGRSALFGASTMQLPEFLNALPDPPGGEALANLPTGPGAWQPAAWLWTGGTIWPSGGALRLGQGPRALTSPRPLPAFLAEHRRGFGDAYLASHHGSFGALALGRHLAQGDSAELGRSIAGQQEALAKSRLPRGVRETLDRHRRIAAQIGTAGRVAAAAAEAASAPTPTAERYPRLRRALAEGRITGANRPDPASRMLRTFESDPEPGEAGQVGFGRAGDPPADHQRRPLVG